MKDFKLILGLTTINCEVLYNNHGNWTCANCLKAVMEIDPKRPKFTCISFDIEAVAGIPRDPNFRLLYDVVDNVWRLAVITGERYELHRVTILSDQELRVTVELCDLEIEKAY